MHIYLQLGNLKIPAYGTMIVLGVLVANLIAVFVLKKSKLDVNDLIIIEAYCALFGFLGAKLLYFIVSFNEIEWSNILDYHYINYLMNSGFVFYGGLIGGLIGAFLAGFIHKINTGDYVINFIFLIPLIHCFGRIGCFMAGCCYGIPYNGIGAVVFPENSFAIPNVPLFPVQLVESFILLIIAVIILVAQLRFNCRYTIEIYLILYAVCRFGLEYFRYDKARGFFAGLSTSQWISILFIFSGVISYVVRKKHKKNKA